MKAYIAVHKDIPSSDLNGKVDFFSKGLDNCEVCSSLSKLVDRMPELGLNTKDYYIAHVEFVNIDDVMMAVTCAYMGMSKTHFDLKLLGVTTINSQ